MSIDEIKSLPVDERLRLMEEIWESLVENEDTLESPAWHEEELRKREEIVKEGKEDYISWDQAKKELKARRKS